MKQKMTSPLSIHSTYAPVFTYRGRRRRGRQCRSSQRQCHAVSLLSWPSGSRGDVTVLRVSETGEQHSQTMALTGLPSPGAHRGKSRDSRTPWSWSEHLIVLHLKCAWGSRSSKPSATALCWGSVWTQCLCRLQCLLGRGLAGPLSSASPWCQPCEQLPRGQPCVAWGSQRKALGLSRPSSLVLSHIQPAGSCFPDLRHCT